jgi:hypothetical protein
LLFVFFEPKHKVVGYRTKKEDFNTPLKTVMRRLSRWTETCSMIRLPALVATDKCLHRQASGVVFHNADAFALLFSTFCNEAAGPGNYTGSLFSYLFPIHKEL